MQSMANLLREGMRAALSCQILEGDLPITFKWEKNGRSVAVGNGMTTRRLDEFSNSLVIERVSSNHSGNYTCVASNVAGNERFTVPLTVNGNLHFRHILLCMFNMLRCFSVPPRWTVEPSDSNAAAGQDVTLHCQADGYPLPTITWRKAVGEISSSSIHYIYIKYKIYLHTLFCQSKSEIYLFLLFRGSTWRI